MNVSALKALSPQSKSCHRVERAGEQESCPSQWGLGVWGVSQSEGESVRELALPPGDGGIG